MRYVITGGAGYIGSRLVDHLLRRDDTERIVVCDVRPPVASDAKVDFERLGLVVVDEQHAHQAALPSELSAVFEGSMIRSSIRHVSPMIRSYSCFMKVRSRPLASANRAALCCTTPIR